MKPGLKLFFKSMLLFGTLYTIISVGINLAFGDEIIWWKLLYRITLLSLIWSSITIPIHLNTLKQIKKKASVSEDLKLVKLPKIRSAISTEKLFKKMKKDAVFGKSKFIEQEGGFKIDTGFSWESLGEIVQIKTKKTADNLFEYELQSQSKWSFILPNLNKNLSNLNYIKQVIAHSPQ